MPDVQTMPLDSGARRESAERTVLLNERDYLATMAEPMKELGTDYRPTVDLWRYVGLIPPQDLQGFVLRDRVVERVYRTPDARYDHVLLPARTANVYLVLVVSRPDRKVHGHHLLNLNEKYGLPTPDAANPR